jgi:tricorn protease
MPLHRRKCPEKQEMDRYMRITLIAMILLICLSLGALTASFPYFPALTPDGETVCFSYFGSLWSVPFEGGTATRLTAGDYVNYGPVYSPDGKWIAFNSFRQGCWGVYIMPAQGGESRLVCAEGMWANEWYPDGKALLLNNDNPDHETSLYRAEIPAEGVAYRPIEISGVGSNDATITPDGKTIFFSRRGDFYRPKYQGSDNGELWMFDGTDYPRLTNTPLSERNPVCAPSGIARYALVSDGKTFQLVRSEKGDFTDKRILSQFKDRNPRSLCGARNVDRLAMVVFDRLWGYDAATGKLAEIPVDIREDLLPDPVVKEKVQNHYDSYQVSSNGKLVAFTYKFDLFAMPEAGDDVKPITVEHTGVTDFQIMDDNRTVYYTKRVNGEPRLFRVKIDDLTHPEAVAEFQDDYIESIGKDPVKRLLINYSNGEKRNRVAILDSLGHRRNLIDDVVWDDLAVSPDGRYAVVCTTNPTNWTQIISLYDMNTDSLKTLTKRENWLVNFVWGTDGKTLFCNFGDDIYRWDLSPRNDYWNRKDYWKGILEQPKEKPKDKKKKKDHKEPPKPTIVQWSGIDQRLERIINRGGECQVLKALDDSTLYYIQSDNGRSILRKADYNGQKDDQVAVLPNIGDDWQFMDKARRFYYLDDHRLMKYDIRNKKTDSINNAFHYEYNRKALNAEIFQQAWVEFGRGFYDPAMHGADWIAIHDLYSTYLPECYTPGILAEIMSSMIGEVNASHTGFYARDDNENSSYVSTATVGLEFDLTGVQPDKGVRIRRVYHRSALFEPYGVRAGDVLLSVDGVQITPKTALQPLFIGKVKERLLLEIAHGDSTIHAEVKGISPWDDYNLRYETWVWERSQMVDKWSKGRIGYLHIESMDWPSYNKFLDDLQAKNFDKDALIIDVRYNGGGFTHDKLIETLSRKAYALETDRTFNTAKRKTPGDTFEKPMAVLCNEESFSDAEIFPTLFQELHLGKVIGMPTSGSVIGTGHYWFMDGSSMRMPSNGWFTLAGKNMEGHGVQPDILVEPTPKQIIADDDIQLKTAVGELQKEIDKK